MARACQHLSLGANQANPFGSSFKQPPCGVHRAKFKSTVTLEGRSPHGLPLFGTEANPADPVTPIVNPVHQATLG